MPKSPPPELPSDAADASFEESFYEVPADLEDRTARAEPSAARAAPPDDDEPELRPLRRGFPALQVGIALGVIVLLLAVVLVYRSRERHRALREGIVQADKLMRADTADGYRKAARFLEQLGDLDPLQVASARAFALAMLAADYRDTQAEAAANKLLVDPSRAEQKPARAALAFAALRLSTNTLGDATNELGYAADDDPWVKVLKARIALRADTPEAAVEPASAAAAVSGFAPGLAVHGDAVRRARHDGAAAYSAYTAAIAAAEAADQDPAAASLPPRAVFGLAKLALTGQAPAAEATERLRRLLGDSRTPAPERARAALHLSALRLRAGETGADAPLDDPSLNLDEAARTWAQRAAAAEAANKGAYKAVTGAPLALESASDDDRPELRPLAPPPPPPAVQQAPPAEEPRPAAKPAPHGKTAKASAVKAGKGGKSAAKNSRGSAKAKVTAKASAKTKAAATKKPVAKKKTH